MAGVGTTAGGDAKFPTRDPRVENPAKPPAERQHAAIGSWGTSPSRWCYSPCRSTGSRIVAGNLAMCVRSHTWVMLVTAIMAAQVANASRAEGPLMLDEIADLREQKQNPGQIVRVAKERGRGFPVDEAARKRLQELGFTPTAIAALAKVKEEIPPAAPNPAPDVAAGEAAVREHDPEVDQIDRIVKETVADTGVRLTAWEGDRCRIFAGPGVPPEFAADARQLEPRFAAVFPRSFVTGIDRRTVNVLIVATRSEYAQLLASAARAAENNGRPFVWEDGRSLEEVGKDKPAIYLHGFTTMCLEATTPEHARRTAAHSFGFHALEHASRHRAGDALTNGFGNVTEVMLFQTPATTVAGGYADRQVGGAGAWPELVRRRFAEQRIHGLERTLDGNFASMEMPDYAEAWSLTELLCLAPDKFVTAVAAMRGGDQPVKAIVDAYGLDEAAIVTKWRQRAAAR